MNMTGADIVFQCADDSGISERRVHIGHLVIAGWTGRNKVAMNAHIEELAAIGVPRPATTPIFYRVSASLLTNDNAIEVSGKGSSGEVEPVLVSLDDGLWVGVGSDHTDREAETAGITIAKQLCPKVISKTLWRFDDVAAHWDDLQLRSHAVIGGQRRLYQEGKTSVMLRPEDLITRYAGRADGLAPGSVMFCGTMAVHGGIEPGEVFETELTDPAMGREISHTYRIDTLPIAG